VRKTGFTLIELLIVIAIMMILVTITVSQFQTAKKKASDVARKADLNGVSKALQMYFADYGIFPAANAGKIDVGDGPIDWGDEFSDKGYVYMKVLPKENKIGATPYCYKTDLGKKKYALLAQLENSVDSECGGHAYSCAGETYCFAYVSPNTSLNNNGDLQ
jgi:type II secretion system protein G